MSKIESALDKTVAKLPLLKNWVMARLCKVWHKISPTFSLKQKLDYPTAKALVLQYKWRIVIVALIFIMLFMISIGLDELANPRVRKAR